MPRLGETITEGTVLRWLKAEGDEVAKDESIVEISTDKVDSEIPSPVGGRVSRILVPEGETVPVGTELAKIEEAAVEAAAQVTGVEAARPAEVLPPTEAPPRAEPTPAEAPRLAEAAPPSTAPPPIEAAKAAESAPETGVVSPLVRKLAKERNVDLSTVKGTGSGRRITKDDVLRAASAGAGEMPARESAPGPAAEELQRFVIAPEGAREEKVPLSHMRKAIAEHMLRSQATSAHVTAIVEVDMSHVARTRRAFKETFVTKEGFSLTYLPFVSWAACGALLDFPVVNSELQGDSLLVKRYVNLGIAVSLDDGLIVPVIKGAHEMDVVQLARAIHDLAEKARGRRLHPDDVHGGTFTITNPGTYGSLMQTPIINQPQLAILSFERIEKRPVVIDDAIAIRDMVYMPCSYDHRVLDGAVVTQFLVRMKELLETADFAAQFEQAGYAAK